MVLLKVGFVAEVQLPAKEKVAVRKQMTAAW